MSSHRTVLTALTLAVGLLAAACGGGQASPATPDGQGARAGDSATETPASGPATFTAAALGGGELSSSSLEGADTVLWFWAPWCTVCRAEADDVVAAATTFDGKVRVVGVAGRGEVAEMEAFVSDTDTGTLTHVVDADGSIWSAYGVFAQPAFAFIDDSGDVEVFVGALGEDGLSERMTALSET
jgi:thiol-disulfide isomerase/thioredoxin